MSKQFYEVPVTWSCYGDVIIEADSLEDAIEKAHEVSLPVGVYLEDTFEIYEEEIITINNKSKKEIIDSEIKSCINDMQNNMHEVRNIIKNNPDLNLNLSDYLDYITNTLYKE